MNQEQLNEAWNLLIKAKANTDVALAEKRGTQLGSTNSLRAFCCAGMTAAAVAAVAISPGRWGCR